MPLDTHNIPDNEQTILRRGPSQKMLLTILGVVATIAVIVPHKKGGTPEKVPQEPVTTSYNEGTKDIQNITAHLQDATDAIIEQARKIQEDMKEQTRKIQEDMAENARVKALFDEAENKKKKNEEIFAEFQRKIKDNPLYTPTRTERIALAQLGIAVNDGAPIPYEGDGKEE